MSNSNVNGKLIDWKRKMIDWLSDWGASRLCRIVLEFSFFLRFLFIVFHKENQFWYPQNI